jgi:predicted RNase H-like HicB family nuclease
MEYDVVVWRGTLSDGSICYAAVCPAISHAHGQGETEAEALVDVADTMALFVEKMPGKVKTGQAAQDALSEECSELTSDGVVHWVRQLEPRRNSVPV